MPFTQPLNEETSKRASSISQLQIADYAWHTLPVTETDWQRFPAADRPHIRSILDWLFEFIMRPHAEMGRPGAVCPFVQPALAQQSLLINVCRPEPSSESVISTIIPYCQPLLNRLKQEEDHGMPTLSCCMLIFPELPDDPAFMEPLHARLKTELMPLGLMAGQFYSSCQVGSTWGPAFKPLQSPRPMFVLRKFITSDWRFIRGNPSWERYYKQCFGEPKPLE